MTGVGALYMRLYCDVMMMMLQVMVCRSEGIHLAVTNTVGDSTRGLTGGTLD